MTVKLAVTGEIRAGKDLFAAVVLAEFQFMEKLYFAKGIENVISNLFPEVWNKEEKPRKHYQHIGQEMRKLNPDVWVNQLAKEYIYLQNYYGIGEFIVTDLRQLNEAAWLKNNGFTIVKIEADKAVRIERMKAAGDVFTEESLNHETEREIGKLPYDVLITNNGTKEEFVDKCLEFTAKLRGAN